MNFLRFFDPLRALRDLRAFLMTRKRHDFIAMGLSAAIVVAVLFAFWKDSSFERPYTRTIIYFENWRLDRSKDEIIAKQALDQAEKAKRDAEREQREAERREQFQRVDNWLTERGI